MEDVVLPQGMLHPFWSPGVLPVARVLAGMLCPLPFGSVRFLYCYWCYKRGLCGHAESPRADL